MSPMTADVSTSAPVSEYVKLLSTKDALSTADNSSFISAIISASPFTTTGNSLVKVKSAIVSSHVSMMLPSSVATSVTSASSVPRMTTPVKSSHETSPVTAITSGSLLAQATQTAPALQGNVIFDVTASALSPSANPSASPSATPSSNALAALLSQGMDAVAV